jgi:hypothetical protein
VTGLAIGGWLTPFLYGGFVGPAYFWKFHASVPACLLALVVAKHFKPWFAIGAMGFLAIVSAVLDTRSIALLCLITAGITALATMRTSRLRRAVAPISKTSIVVAGLLLLSVALGAVFFVKYFGDRYGYSKRGANSDATRLANAQVAFSAIKASPIIGYGSWPRNPELARQRDKLVAKAKGIPVNRMASQEDLIISHSQILQGWVEGGVLGFIFFVVLGWLIGKTLFWQTLIGPYSPLTPLLTFVLLECMWSLFLSPFSGGQRVYIPAACVFMCYVVEKRRQTHAGSSYLAWNSLPAS